MSNSVFLIVLSLVAILACLMTTVTSSPSEVIHPVVALDQMEPDHSCLFICNICFPGPEDSEHLMDCTERVCGSVAVDTCAMEKFIWLGHHCKHYNMVENMWTDQ